MPFASIRTKLTAWYVVLLGVILILFSVFLNVFLAKRLYESVDHSLKVSATIVAKTESMKFSQSSVPGMDQFFEQFFGYEKLNKFYKIYDGSGNVGSRSRNIDASQFPLSQAAYSAALKGETTYETFYIGEVTPVRMITMPILREGALANLIQVGTSLEPVRETLKNLRLFLFFSVPMVLLLATFVGRFMARRALKPVSEVTRIAREVGGSGDLSKRIPLAGGEDEISNLVSTFNEMLDRLDGSFAQVRQFSSDASHELRTPLTVLKGQNELALNKERSLEDYQEVICSNLEEINYMSKILEDLFLLSRSDENQIQLDYKPLDLRGVVEEVFRHAEIIAEEKKINVRIVHLDSVRIHGDAVRLRQMIWNILHNAIKYTQPGGEIRISLADVGDWAVVTVQDTGIGISEKDLPFIFNRFYRVDKARSRKVGGTGLGLSICKFIVDAHKGEILVESELGVGSCFKVRLPKILSFASAGSVPGGQGNGGGVADDGVRTVGEGADRHPAPGA
ncbi:MAG: heavy metal sensor histidine kinase [Nitrospinaceae bacterium]|nr:MAG: heavy metal sensor histidine kinase [Nitrospinaceae bacterium]